MSDLLVELGKNRAARSVIGRLGLPVALPQDLRRAGGPWEPRPLEDRQVLVAGGGELHGVVARTLAHAGADAVLADPELRPHYAGAAEAWSRPLTVASEGQRVDAIVLDATAVTDLAGLKEVYRALHPTVRGVASCGRVVILGRPSGSQATAAGAAACQALHGLTRSLAKELGRKGSTANLVELWPDAEGSLEPLLRWLLSDRSAFLTGQPFELSDTVSPPERVALVRPLDGKTALVTGAAQGIGAQIARRLAEEGARVYGLDRPEEAERLAGVLQPLGGVPVLVNLTDAQAGQQVVEALKGRSLDVLVHNAGVTRDRTLGRMEEGLWDLCLDVNLDAVLRLNEALVDGVLVDGGRMVLLSSIAGIAGNVGQTNYAASKAGIIGLTRFLAGQLSPRGITVNAVAPGFIETRLTAAIPLATREPARRLSSLAQGGLPVDVAEAITFLCTPGAAGLTGQVHRVCGQHMTGA